MACGIHCAHRDDGSLDQMPGAQATLLEEQHPGLFRPGVAYQSLGLIALLGAIIPCSGQLNGLRKLVSTW